MQQQGALSQSLSWSRKAQPCEQSHDWWACKDNLCCGQILIWTISNKFASCISTFFFSIGMICKVLTLQFWNCFYSIHQFMDLKQVLLLCCKRCHSGTCQMVSVAAQRQQGSEKLCLLPSHYAGHMPPCQKICELLLVLSKKSDLFGMGAEIVQIFVCSLLDEGDKTSFPQKMWPPEKFWHTCCTTALPTCRKTSILQKNKYFESSVCFFLRLNNH